MQPIRGNLAPLTLASKAPVLSWWQPTGVAVANVIAAYASKGAPSQADSYTNLAHPATNDATVIVAPTWSSSVGWTSAGAAGLRTGIVWTNNQTWSAFVRFTGATSGALSLFGTYMTDNNTFCLFPNYTSNVHYRHGALFSEGTGLAAGVLGIAGRKGYRNGTPTTGTIPTKVSGTNIREMYLFGLNFNDTLAAKYIGSIQAAVFFDITLTDAQALELSNNMAAL